MSSSEEMLQAFERYRSAFNVGQRQSVLDCFVEEPFVEEPVGSTVRRGRAQIEAVLDGLAEAGITAQIGVPSSAIAGVNNELAVAFVATATGQTGVRSIPAIEIFTIAPDGRIEGMRAFVSPEQLAPSGAPPEGGPE